MYYNAGHASRLENKTWPEILQEKPHLDHWSYPALVGRLALG